MVRFNRRKSGPLTGHGGGYWDMSSNSSLLFQEKALEKTIRISDSANMALIAYSWYPTLITNKEALKRILPLKIDALESDFDTESHIIERITPVSGQSQLLFFASTWELVEDRRDFLKPANLAKKFIFSYITGLDCFGIVAFALSVRQFMVQRPLLNPEQIGHTSRVLAYIIIGWITHLGLDKVAELHFQTSWKKKYAESLTNEHALEYLKKLEEILDATSNQQALFSQMTVKTFEEDVNRLGEKIVRASVAMNPPLSITVKKRKRKPEFPDLLEKETSDEESFEEEAEEEHVSDNSTNQEETQLDDVSLTDPGPASSFIMGTSTTTVAPEIKSEPPSLKKESANSTLSKQSPVQTIRPSRFIDTRYTIQERLNMGLARNQLRKKGMSEDEINRQLPFPALLK